MSAEVPGSVLPYENSSLGETSQHTVESWREIGAHRSLSSTDTHRSHKHLDGVETVKKTDPVPGSAI